MTPEEIRADQRDLATCIKKRVATIDSVSHLEDFFRHHRTAIEGGEWGVVEFPRHPDCDEIIAAFGRRKAELLEIEREKRRAFDEWKPKAKRR